MARKLIVSLICDLHEAAGPARNAPRQPGTPVSDDRAYPWDEAEKDLASGFDVTVPASAGSGITGWAARTTTRPTGRQPRHAPGCIPACPAWPARAGTSPPA